MLNSFYILKERQYDEKSLPKTVSVCLLSNTKKAVDICSLRFSKFCMDFCLEMGWIELMISHELPGPE